MLQIKVPYKAEEQEGKVLEKAIPGLSPQTAVSRVLEDLLKANLHASHEVLCRTAHEQLYGLLMHWQSG